VALVGRTAKTVLDHDCAIPMVDSIEHRRQHADIRLRPRDGRPRPSVESPLRDG
jgi:hypothetical protein